MVGARNMEREGLLLVDLGSSAVRVLAAVRDAAGLQLCAAAEQPCSAGRDGVLVHRELAREQLGAAVQEAVRQAGIPLRRAIAALGGTHLGMLRTSGSLQLKLPVSLRQTHLEQALEKAACIGLPPDQEVLHVLPTSHRVDGATVARSPVGVRARLLVVECALVTASRLALDNLERVFADLDLELLDVAAEPLVTAGALLGAEDRRRGAVLVDIGAERIGAVVYREHVLQGLACLGVGSAHVSRDLAYALQLEFAAAEELKQRFGVAVVTAAAPGAETEIRRAGGSARLGQEALAGVIEPRWRELLGLVRDALRRSQALAPGDRVVLGGQGARLPGSVAVAEAVFGLPARLAEECSSIPAAAAPAALRQRTSATALGLLDYASRCAAHGARRGPAWRDAVQRLRHVFAAAAARRTTGAAVRRATSIEAAARQGGHEPLEGGVDLEVDDVRVRT